MTTINKLTHQVKRLLSSGTTPKDSKLSDAYIQSEIRQVTHQLLKAEYYTYKNEGFSDPSPLCIATYENVPVLNDTLRKRNYCAMPAYPMNLPGGIGVQQVKPQTGIPARDVAMIPVMPLEFELFKSLLVGAEVMSDQFTFEVDRNKIFFTKKSDKSLLDSGITAVEIKLLVHDPSQIGIDDPYPISPEMEVDVLKGVLLLHNYTGREVADLINDGNPNTK